MIQNYMIQTHNSSQWQVANALGLDILHSLAVVIVQLKYQNLKPNKAVAYTIPSCSKLQDIHWRATSPPYTEMSLCASHTHSMMSHTQQ